MRRQRFAGCARSPRAPGAGIPRRAGEPAGRLEPATIAHFEPTPKPPDASKPYVVWTSAPPEKATPTGSGGVSARILTPRGYAGAGARAGLAWPLLRGRAPPRSRWVRRSKGPEHPPDPLPERTRGTAAAARAVRRPCAQHAQVLTIHRQNQIEALEVAGFHNARAQRREVISTAGGSLPVRASGGSPT